MGAAGRTIGHRITAFGKVFVMHAFLNHHPAARTGSLLFSAPVFLRWFGEEIEAMPQTLSANHCKSLLGFSKP
jgi:hypothetical protein